MTSAFPLAADVAGAAVRLDEAAGGSRPRARRARHVRPEPADRQHPLRPELAASDHLEAAAAQAQRVRCVRACVRARVRVCACARVDVRECVYVLLSFPQRQNCRP